MPTMSRKFLQVEKLPSNQSFGRVMGSFFLLLWIYFSWKKQFFAPPILLGTSFLFFALAQWFPKTLRWLNYLWTLFGKLLHLLISPIILGGIFFGVFWPMGILIRVFKGDPLRRKFDPQSASYWIPRDKSADLGKQMKMQF